MLSIEERNRLALKHLSLINTVVHGGRDDSWRDDLRQECFIALLKAAQRFNPSKRKTFRVFAYKHLWGAVRDYHRRFPSLKNRHKMRQADETVDTDIKLPGRVSPVCMKLSREKDPADAAEEVDSAYYLVRRLGPRSRMVVLHRVLAGRYFFEIGDDLGITASRACQLYHEGLARCRQEAS